MAFITRHILWRLILGLHCLICSVQVAGTVIDGKRVFLAYINDLPDQVRSRVRLFADDTAMYLALDRQDNSEILQKDLESFYKSGKSSGT